MKKIANYLIVLLVVLVGVSCEEVDYKNMNITKYEEEVDIKEFVGSLTSHIVVKSIANQSLTEVNMGETFYIIDNTDGGASSRTWTITQGKTVNTYQDQLVRLTFGKPGKVTVNLKSVRASDGVSVSSEVVINVKSIPVAAGFITEPLAVGGKIKIFEGASIAFTAVVEGSPTSFEWVFKGPETITSTEKNPTITFLKAGDYSVTFTASRDDGDEGISKDTEEKPALVKVDKLIVELVRAIATDNKILLEYSNPINGNLVAGVENEYSIVINTSKGSVLKPNIISAKAAGTSAIEVIFADKMYSDDEVLLTFKSSGKLKDATGLITLASYDSEPCVYGKSLAYGDMEDESKLAKTANSTGNGYFSFVNENSSELAQKPYQGNKCIAIVRGNNNVGVGLLQGYTVNEGDVFEFAYEALTIENVPGALERRMSLVAGDGSNAAGGNWMSAADNGKGTGNWTTIRKTIKVSADTKGQKGTLYLHFFRYGGGSDTAAIWIDNLRIYIPNPRP